MAYRNGTYVTFHAEGTSDPTDSDQKYYRLLQAWNANDDFDFQFVNSHEKTSAVRDTSKKATLEARLKERLNNSKNMVIIMSEATRLDNDWVPFEIRYAADNCKIPLIIAYVGQEKVTATENLKYMWPVELSKRINNKSIYTVHVPFKEKELTRAVKQFDHNSPPKYIVTVYK